MAIKAFADFNCSVARPLSFLGERWALLVLRDLFLGRRRFEEFQDSLGIATNVLSQRLATLVEEGIVERRRYSEHPERFEYRLTEKGRDLQPVLLAMLAWGDRYTAGPAGPPLETVHEGCGHAFHMVPTCSECGEPVDPRNIHSRPGPGATERQRERYEELRQRRAGERAAAEEPRAA
jgi:DNA-binding HxlR family transcriptional regulator